MYLLYAVRCKKPHFSLAYYDVVRYFLTNIKNRQPNLNRATISFEPETE